MVEFTWISLLFMILILGMIWGGFGLVLYLAMNFEKRKQKRTQRNDPGSMN